MRLILHNLKHFFITFFICLIIVVGIGIYIGADAHFMQNPLAYKLDGEGPHIFYKNDKLSVETIRGSRDEGGFYIESEMKSLDKEFDVEVYFPLEEYKFQVVVNPEITTPPSQYDDGEPIVAISDIESGFKTFRDFLIVNKVINQHLEWIFDKGHLVLVGDFVDRGDSVTQVLWFIYHLEQQAKAAGGMVHFILGNHEIKNLQGNYKSASEKYYFIASMLARKQHELYGNDSFIGRWMASKNSIELINGYLFTHGGIAPKSTEYDISLEQLNELVRREYRDPYFTKKGRGEEAFWVSTTTGPSWYRGYFKDDLSQADVESGLNKFGAKAVIVGHTIQSKVTKLFNGKVFAIDVKHPKDYLSSFPFRKSEGLLIDRNGFYRLLDDGEKILL